MNMLKVTKNDETDSDISIASCILLQAIITTYGLESEATIYETAHGHIAHMYKSSEVPYTRESHEPLRLSMHELKAFSSIPSIRWIEASNGKFVIAFDNDATAADLISKLATKAA